MEHGTLGLLGLSSSLLGGGTLGNPPHNMWTPQRPPGPGHSLADHNPQEKSDKPENFPFTGGGCNARGLILDLNRIYS